MVGGSCNTWRNWRDRTAILAYQTSAGCTAHTRNHSKFLPCTLSALAMAAACCIALVPSPKSAPFGQTRRPLSHCSKLWVKVRQGQQSGHYASFAREQSTCARQELGIAPPSTHSISYALSNPPNWLLHAAAARLPSTTLRRVKGTSRFRSSHWELAPDNPTSRRPGADEQLVGVFRRHPLLCGQVPSGAYPRRPSATTERTSREQQKPHPPLVQWQCR